MLLHLFFSINFLGIKRLLRRHLNNSLRNVHVHRLRRFLLAALQNINRGITIHNSRHRINLGISE